MGVQSWAQVGGQAQLPLGKEVLLGIRGPEFESYQPKGASNLQQRELCGGPLGHLVAWPESAQEREQNGDSSG